MWRWGSMASTKMDRMKQKPRRKPPHAARVILGAWRSSGGRRKTKNNFTRRACCALCPGCHAKLDSCAIVNLSNSKYCTNINPCHEHGLPPIQLSGIGGSTDPIHKAGLIIAIVKGRKKIAHAYILDQEVAGNKAISSIGMSI
jgi:hypothetical protein